MPAAGQGALALEAVAGALEREALAAVADAAAMESMAFAWSGCDTRVSAPSRCSCTPSGASCHTPVGAHARLRADGAVELVGWLPDGSAWLGDAVAGDFREVGAVCADRMRAAGADELLRQAEARMVTA